MMDAAMPTLLLSARQTEDAQKLWKACISTNWKVVRAHNWQVPSLRQSEVAIYGEPLFAQHAARQLGLHLLEPPLDWLPRLSHLWRGREVNLTTLAEARNITERSFIKPADEKCFDARVYDSGKDLPAPGPLPEDLPVLVQEVVDWTIEFRCFVLERRVVTLSPYWRNGALAKTGEGSWSAEDAEWEQAKRFCGAVVSDLSVALPEAVVVDVGTIRDRGWAVVECNAAFAAGLYGCNPVSVLRVLQTACRSESVND
jgi:hypothetical protein